MQDPAARDALIADVRKHIEEMASVTKEHMTVRHEHASMGGVNMLP
jgi:hypothetical protein